MTDNKNPVNARVGVAFSLLDLDLKFMGEMDYSKGETQIFAAARNVDIGRILAELNVGLPPELGGLNLLIDTLYLRLDTNGYREFYCKIKLKKQRTISKSQFLNFLRPGDRDTNLIDKIWNRLREKKWIQEYESNMACVFIPEDSIDDDWLDDELKNYPADIQKSTKADIENILFPQLVLGSTPLPLATLKFKYREDQQSRSICFKVHGDFKSESGIGLGSPYFACQEFNFKFVYDEQKASGTQWQLKGDIQIRVFGEDIKFLAGYKDQGQEKELTLKADNFEIAPLSVFPDIPSDLKPLFAVGLDEVNLIKSPESGWEFSAGIYLRLKKIDAPVFDPINKIFYPPGNENQQLTGRLTIGSGQKVAFVLENTFPLIIPSIFDKLDIPPELKALDDIKRLFDIGTTYFCLDKIKIEISDTPGCEATLAIGLPSRLNDVFFGKESPFNGLIRTYDETDFARARANFLRATLKVESSGISGWIDKGDILDLKKLDQITDELARQRKQIFNLSQGIKQEGGLIKINFDALFQADYRENSKPKYGYIHIKMPRLKLDTTSGAFSASGGYNVSQPLMLPIRPIFEKLLLLCQDPAKMPAAPPQILDLLPDGIPIENIHFFENGVLDLDPLEDWLRKCLPPALKPLFELPAPFKQFIEQEAGAVLNKLPEAFKQYLQIKFPSAFDFAVDITADGGVSFSIDVPDKITGAAPPEAANAKAFEDCIQLLVPVPGSIGMIYGIQLKKLAFGAALGGACLRLDLSARLDAFDLIQLGASLLLPDKHGIPQDPLFGHLDADQQKVVELMLPDRRKLGTHLMVENLVLLIIYETGVPIPIPVYYNKIYSAYTGLEGLDSELFLCFKTGFSLADITRLFDLIRFFREKNEPLTVDPYPYDPSAGESGIVFGAGPLYTRLPGYIGYEEIGGAKQNILIGTEETYKFNLLDLVALGANTLKFLILNLVDAVRGKPRGEMTKIPVKLKDQTAPVFKKPLNYLIEYLPVDMRMGFKKIMLFYLFELQTGWAFTTPDEFEQVVQPRLLKEYVQRNYPQTGDPSSPGELLQLLAERDAPAVYQDEDQGVVLFLQGGMYCAQKQVVLEGAIGLSVSEQKGFRTGLSLKGKLFDWIESASFFFAKINPAAAKEIIKVIGSTYFSVFERDVLAGKIEVTNEQLKFQGMLNALPDGFPIQLKGFVNGEFSPRLIDFSGSAGLQLGLFSAAARLNLHIDRQKQLFESDLVFANALWHFSVAHSREGDQEWFRADLSANAFNLIAVEGHLRFKRDSRRLQLLGMVSLDFPALRILRVQLDYAGELNAETGFLSLSAQLGANSYILSENCRPTGGAALYIWFDESRGQGAGTANRAVSGPTAGDFVLTLGGYHPNFRVPPHYPRVPRLGINWEIDAHTHIRGEAYFAMTPLAVMAGAKLDLVYQRGNVRAWFLAYADFLCRWSPLYFDVNIGVSVGASYTLRVGVRAFGKFIGVVKTFSVSVKAQLHLWGPPTGGRVDIKLPIITIGIRFGPAYRQPEPLKNWQAFKDEFFPPTIERPGKDQAKVANPILQLVPQGGVTAVKNIDGNKPAWIARADEFSFMITTKIPAGIDAGKEGLKPIDIKPLGKVNISSTLKVELHRDGKPVEKLQTEPLTGSVPAALWGSPDTDLLDNSKALIAGAVVGLRVSARKGVQGQAPVLEVFDQNLGYSEIETANGQQNLPDPGALLKSFAPAQGKPAQLLKAIQTTQSTRDRVLEQLVRSKLFRKADGPDLAYDNFERVVETDWQHCPGIVE